MKIQYNIYPILVTLLLFIQQIISGCTTTVTKELQKDNLYRDEIPQEDIHKKDLPTDKLRKVEVGPTSQNLFHEKCSLCHDLPDINTYPYTPEQWAAVIDNMHETKESRKFITIEEENKIKAYLGKLSQTR